METLPEELLGRLWNPNPFVNKGRVLTSELLSSAYDDVNGDIFKLNRSEKIEFNFNKY